MVDLSEKDTVLFSYVSTILLTFLALLKIKNQDKTHCNSLSLVCTKFFWICCDFADIYSQPLAIRHTKVESLELIRSSAQEFEMISMGRLLTYCSSHANHFHLGPS